jgi:DNA repair protein RecO (recombination protein O)
VLTVTEGIVLKTQGYAEADLIITYLTLNRGIIKIFAKSPRKTKSRFGSSLEPLTHAKITLVGKEQSMPRLIQSDILKSFQQLRENFHDFINILKLAEILISLTPEGAPNKKLFLFFLNIMNLIESLNPVRRIAFSNGVNQKQKDSLYLISQIHLLVLLGYAPRLKGCGRCGAKSFDFYPDSGTTLCKKCAIARTEKNISPIKITGNIVKFYSHCIGWPIQTSIRLKPPKEIISTLSALLEEHLNHLLNRRLMTSEFLTKV